MEGTLEENTVPEVVHKFANARQSGVLHLSRGKTTKRIYFRDGAIVFASSDDAEERLGERLVRAGTLKRSALDLACQVLSVSRLRLGTTLVEMGYLSTEELDLRVREQVKSIIHSLFPWDSGAYRSENNERPISPDLERADLSTAAILLEGVRGIEDFRTIRRGLKDLDGPLHYALDPKKLLSELQLTPAEGFVLSRVDGATSPGEIAQLSPMGEEETLRCVYALMAAGILETRPAAKAAAAAPHSSPSAKPAEASPEVQQFLERMREKQRTVRRSTLYEILEVEPSAVPEAIKAAYFRLAKQLHPDHTAGLKLQDADGVLDDLYLRVKGAYEVLSSETERRRYDFGLLQKAMRTARADASAAANPAPKGSIEPPPAQTETNPKNTFTTTQSARLHFANGERYFGEGRYHEAIEELRAAVRLEPVRADYQRLLGRALSKNPKWRKQAEDAFSKALEINRFDVEALVELGELYLEGGLETRARKMFEEALAVDPDNVRALEKFSSTSPGSSALGKLKDLLKRPRT